MKKLLIILLLVVSVNAQEEAVRYYYYYQYENSLVYSVSLPGQDTTMPLHSPLTAGLRFDGGTRGDYARNLGSDSAWAYLFNALDSGGGTMTLSMPIRDNGKYITGWLASSRGWIVGYGTNATNVLSISFVTGWQDIGVIIDSLDHTITWYVNRLTNTLKVWKDDTLKINNTSFTPSTSPMPAGFMNYRHALGHGEAVQFSTSDTTQQPSGTTAYSKYVLKKLNLWHSHNGIHKYMNMEFPGCGYSLPDSATIINYDYRGNYTGQIPASNNFEFGYAGDNNIKAPYWVVYSGTRPSFVDTVGGLYKFDSSTDNWRYGEAYTNGSCLWRDTTIVWTGLFNCYTQPALNVPGTVAKYIVFYTPSSGLWSVPNGFPNNTVTAVTDWNGLLPMGGTFTSCAGINDTGIILYNGNNYVRLDSGLNNNVNGVYADPVSGGLIVLGVFTGSKKQTALNGIAWISDTSSEWTPYGTGINGTGWCAIRYNGDLYIAGQYGTLNGVTCNSFGKWNGTGVAYGTGIKKSTNAGIVYTMAVYNNELIIAGDFDSAGGVYCKNIAAFNGSTFRNIGNITLGSNPDPSVNTVSVNPVYNMLIVTGQFNRLNGTRKCERHLYWNGTDWFIGAGFNKRVEGQVIMPDGSEYYDGDFDAVSGWTVHRICKINPTYIPL